MIKSIRIQGYQSHQNTTLELSPGVNAIIGLTDSGKSAILRAINWGINNKPGGIDFINWDNDTTIVEFDVDNHTVSRKKKIKRLKNKPIVEENAYFIDKEEFKSFGQDVPPEIKKVLNLSSLNYQSQHDKHFLLSNNSGEVARYLNKVTNLEKIDLSTFNITKKVKNLKQSLQTEKASLTTIDNELKQYDWIDNANEKLLQFEKLDEEIERLENNYEALSEIIESIEYIEKKIKEYSHSLKAEKEVEKLLKLKEDIEFVTDKKSNLKNLICDINIIIKHIKNNEEFIHAEEKVNELLNLDKIIIDSEKKLISLESVYDQILSTKENIIQYKEEKKELENKFKQLFPNQCPLCGQEVKK
jgi:exonuclease SbcC